MPTLHADPTDGQSASNTSTGIPVTVYRNSPAQLSTHLQHLRLERPRRQRLLSHLLQRVGVPAHHTSLGVGVGMVWVNRHALGEVFIRPCARSPHGPAEGEGAKAAVAAAGAASCL